MRLSIGIRLETVDFNFYLRVSKFGEVECDDERNLVVELTLGGDVNSKRFWLKSRLAREISDLGGWGMLII